MQAYTFFFSPVGANGNFIYIEHFSICKFNVLNTEYKNRKTCVGFKMP